MEQIKLFKMLHDCFINDENGKEIKISKDRKYWFRFGNNNNGGWPRIYIPEIPKWYDFCMYEDGTAEWDEKPEQIAIDVSEVPEEAVNSDVISRMVTTSFLRNYAKSFDDAKARVIFEAAASLVENADNIPPVTEVSPKPTDNNMKYIEIKVEHGAYEGEKVIINVDQVTHIAPYRQIHLSDGMVISADMESFMKLLDIIGMP